MDYSTFLTGVYQDQLGRAPDPEGAAYWLNALQSGQLTQEQVAAAINQSVEGQNFDTQSITSNYRSLFERNPEQEGYQYWLSVAQQTGATPQELQQLIYGGAQNQDIAAAQQAMANGYYTNLSLPSFESDPYAGRYTSESRYLTDAGTYPNVSYIGNQMYQFMSPITQQPVISKYAPQTWEAQAGLDVLSAPQVDAAINLALKSGTLSQTDYQNIYNDLAKAKSMQDVYTAFNKPQAQVVVDALYGFQTGEAKTLEAAQQEAGIRQQYLDQFGFYPSNFAMADVLQRAGIDYPFTQDEMNKIGKLYTAKDVVTPQNFQSQLNKVLNMSFGNMNVVPTDMGGSYYSERGLEQGYTPLGEAPTFRSGVAGYTPTIPTGLQFGTPVVQAPINLFTPGQFDPNAIGYTQSGQPILATTEAPIA